MFHERAATHMQEQQGFRGRWAKHGTSIDVDLALDGTVCSQQRGYVNLAPMPWHLRCSAVAPAPGNAILIAPVLVCTFAEPVYAEPIGATIHTWRGGAS